MTIPDHLQYTSEDEWVRLDGESAYVGVTDHLQAILGQVSAIGLPEIGRALRTGDPAAVLNSDDGSHTVAAPISGRVLAVNPHIANQPGIVNADPYGKGWLFRLRVEAGEEIEHLLDPNAYRGRFDTPGNAGDPSI